MHSKSISVLGSVHVHAQIVVYNNGYVVNIPQVNNIISLYEVQASVGLVSTFEYAYQSSLDTIYFIKFSYQLLILILMWSQYKTGTRQMLPHVSIPGWLQVLVQSWYCVRSYQAREGSLLPVLRVETRLMLLLSNQHWYNLTPDLHRQKHSSEKWCITRFH